MADYQRGPQPGWAGLVTFLRSKAVDFDELKPGDVAIVGVPHDSTVATRQGARHGPHGIREASLNLVSYLESFPDPTFIDVDSGQTIKLMKPSPLVDLGDLNIYPSQVDLTTESVEHGIKHIVEKGAFPVVLGGDHYITYPLLKGFAGAMAMQGVERIGYIQIDAHLDLVDDHPLWGRFYHGTNAIRSSELPQLHTENMVWIGISSGNFSDQIEWVENADAHQFTSEDVRRMGMTEVIEKACEYAGDGTEVLYVSVDIDCIDSVYAPGTGAVTVGGIRPVDLFIAMEYLAGQNVGGFDLMEVAPPLDQSGRTPRIAFSAILEFLAPKIFEIHEP